MQDRYGRTIDYIRISITDRCNLRCMYCMPQEGIELCKCDDILRYEEIIRLCRIFESLGISKIKITGGEALVRKDALDLIRGIKAIDGIKQVTLTTNGVLLEKYLDELVEAKIDGINISLDTLNAEEFKRITRIGDVETVKKALQKVLTHKDLNIKLNCVPFDTSKQNIIDLVGIAKENNVHIRFIEVMPIGFGKLFQFLGEDQIKQQIEKVYGKMKPFEQKLGNGPSHYYSLDGFQGKIGFISAISHKFCHECNRIRLTCTGYLKTCLQYDFGVDLRALLRSGASDEQIKMAIEKAIMAKPLEHSFLDTSIESEEQATMSAIGG